MQPGTFGIGYAAVASLGGRLWQHVRVIKRVFPRKKHGNVDGHAGEPISKIYSSTIHVTHVP